MAFVFDFLDYRGAPLPRERRGRVLQGRHAEDRAFWQRALVQRYMRPDSTMHRFWMQSARVDDEEWATLLSLSMWLGFTACLADDAARTFLGSALPHPLAAACQAPRLREGHWDVARVPSAALLYLSRPAPDMWWARAAAQLLGSRRRSRQQVFHAVVRALEGPEAALEAERAAAAAAWRPPGGALPLAALPAELLQRWLLPHLRQPERTALRSTCAALRACVDGGAAGLALTPLGARWVELGKGDGEEGVAAERPYEAHAAGSADSAPPAGCAPGGAGGADRAAAAAPPASPTSSSSSPTSGPCLTPLSARRPAAPPQHAWVARFGGLARVSLPARVLSPALAARLAALPRLRSVVLTGRAVECERLAPALACLAGVTSLELPVAPPPTTDPTASPATGADAGADPDGPPAAGADPTFCALADALAALPALASLHLRLPLWFVQSPDPAAALAAALAARGRALQLSVELDWAGLYEAGNVPIDFTALVPLLRSLSLVSSRRYPVLLDGNDCTLLGRLGPRLRCLDLRGCYVPFPDALERLSGLAGLTALRCGFEPYSNDLATPAALARVLSYLPRLRDLAVHDCDRLHESEPLLDAVAALSRLTALSFRHCSLSDEVMSAITSLRRLRSLTLHCWLAADDSAADVAHLLGGLAQLTALTWLDVDGTFELTREYKLPGGACAPFLPARALAAAVQRLPALTTLRAHVWSDMQRAALAFSGLTLRCGGGEARDQGSGAAAAAPPGAGGGWRGQEGSVGEAEGSLASAMAALWGCYEGALWASLLACPSGHRWLAGRRATFFAVVFGGAPARARLRLHLEFDAHGRPAASATLLQDSGAVVAEASGGAAGRLLDVGMLGKVFRWRKGYALAPFGHMLESWSSSWAAALAAAALLGGSAAAADLPPPSPWHLLAASAAALPPPPPRACPGVALRDWASGWVLARQQAAKGLQADESTTRLLQLHGAAMPPDTPRLAWHQLPVCNARGGERGRKWGLARAARRRGVRREAEAQRREGGW